MGSWGQKLASLLTAGAACPWQYCELHVGGLRETRALMPGARTLQRIFGSGVRLEGRSGASLSFSVQEPGTAQVQRMTVT